MKIRLTFWKTLLKTLATALVCVPASVSACAICYGEPDSPIARGLSWAIIALGAIVLTVLSGVVAFFVHVGNHAPPTADDGTTDDHKADEI